MTADDREEVKRIAHKEGSLVFWAMGLCLLVFVWLAATDFHKAFARIAALEKKIQTMEEKE